MSENPEWNLPQSIASGIRRRPVMFLGDTASTGLHRLAFEVINYSLEEISSGHGKSILVQMHVDGSLSVADDGRGIPVDVPAKIGMTTLEWSMTWSTSVEIHGGERVFKTGLHGLGARAVTALSDWAEAEVCCNNQIYRQRYERGLPVGDVCLIGPAGTRTGTKITFHPDSEILHDVAFGWDRLEARLRELAFLNKGVSFKLMDEQTAREEVFCYPKGVAEFLERLNCSAAGLHEPIYVDKPFDDVKVEFAMQYTTGQEERVRCYANNAYNAGGGTHLSGFRDGLTRTLNTYGAKENLFKSDLQLIGEDFREGLTAIISIRVPGPQFDSQSKIRLNNPETEGMVASVVQTEVSKFLKENPEAGHRILKKAVTTAKARQAK